MPKYLQSRSFGECNEGFEGFKDEKESGWRKTLKLCQVGSKLIDTTDCRRNGRLIVNFTGPTKRRQIVAAKSPSEQQWRQVKREYRLKESGLGSATGQVLGKRTVRMRFEKQEDLIRKAWDQVAMKR